MSLRVVLGSATVPLLLALGAAACGGGTAEIASVGPKNVADLPPSAVRGPYVHAGVTVPVRVEQALDSQWSTRGTPFVARTEAPLRADDGTVVVPAGALVHGHVVGTGEGDSPSVRLSIDSVQTARGEARIAADIVQAQRTFHAGPPTVDTAAPHPYATDYTYPMDFYMYGTTEPRRFSTPGSAQDVHFAREVHIPSGARMTLLLTRPIVPPGTYVAP